MFIEETTTASRWNIGVCSTSAPTTDYTQFKSTFYFVLDIVFDSKQSEGNLLLLYFFSSISVT